MCHIHYSLTERQYYQLKNPSLIDRTCTRSIGIFVITCKIVSSISKIFFNIGSTFIHIICYLSVSTDYLYNILFIFFVIKILQYKLFKTLIYRKRPGFDIIRNFATDIFNLVFEYDILKAKCTAVALGNF